MLISVVVIVLLVYLCILFTVASVFIFKIINNKNVTKNTVTVINDEKVENTIANDKFSVIALTDEYECEQEKRFKNDSNR